MLKIKKESLLLEPKDIKPSSKLLEVLGVINPGAARLPDGNIVLFVRVVEKLKKTEDEKYCYAPRMTGKNKYNLEIDKFNKDLIDKKTDLDFIFKDGTKRLTFISHLRRVILNKSGFKVLSVDKTPSFYGIATDGELGIEDARITKINNLYIMTYVSLSRNQNISTSCAISADCLNWNRRGIIFGEQDKDVVIFPEKINGRYVAFDRPEGNFQFTQPHMWVAYSNDIKSWGDLKPIPCIYKKDGFCPRNGAGPPPIKTKKGWLLLYHAVTEFSEAEQEKETLRKLKEILKLKQDVINQIANLKEEVLRKIEVYSIGAALFDLKNPEKIIANSKKFIIIPNGKYDMGTFEHKKVTFPTGALIDRNKKDLLIYSGAGDIRTTVKKVSIADILKHLRKV